LSNFGGRTRSRKRRVYPESLKAKVALEFNQGCPFPKRKLIFRQHCVGSIGGKLRRTGGSGSINHRYITLDEYPGVD
jgi:hypothetical protein